MFGNKTAVVTGASRGIGFATLKKLAETGVNVIACNRECSDNLKSLYDEIALANNVTITPICFDMSDEGSVRAGIKQIKDLKQPISILINNAGMSHIGLFAFTKSDKFHEIFQVNFFSQILIIQGLLTTLSKNKPSAIVNISSIAGIDGGIGVSAYGATKASMSLLTKVLSQELAMSGIRVNAVAPGIIDTSMAEKMGQKAVESTIQHSSMSRLGTVDEVADLIVFLSSERSSYINGQIIQIDGGKI